MGVYSDIANSSNEIAPSAPRGARSRSAAAQLLSQAADPTLSPAFAARNEIQTIPMVADVDDGTWDLTINLRGGITFTAETIAASDNAAAIRDAITAAAIVAELDFEDDISVTGGPIDTAPIVLTFDGPPVAGQNHPLAVVTSDLVDTEPEPLPAPTVQETQAGGPERSAMQALYGLNIVAGPIPGHGEAPQWTKPAPTGKTRARRFLIEDLARLACAQDGSRAIWDAIAKLYFKSQ